MDAFLNKRKLQFKKEEVSFLWSQMEFYRNLLQGLSIPVACIGSGDPVRVLHLYTMNTLDEV